MIVVAKARSLTSNLALHLAHSTLESIECTEAAAENYAEAHQQNQTVQMHHEYMDFSLRFANEVKESYH